MRKIRNFLILLRYWSVLEKASQIIKSVSELRDSELADKLTLDELDGLAALDKILLLLTYSPKENKKDLKELKNKLND